MRRRAPACPLYEVLCPAFYVARVFGLAPYRMPKDTGPPRLRASASNCLYAFFWMIAYSYVLAVTLIRFSHSEDEQPILGVTEKTKLVLNYFVSMVELCLGALHRERYVRVCNSILEFDEAFETTTDAYHLRSLRLYIWLGLGVSAVCWSAIHQLGLYAFDEVFTQSFGYMFTYVGTYIAVLKFCSLAFLLGQRFAYLNGLLVGLQGRHVGDLAVVKKIESHYNQLLGTGEYLKSIYSWSLLLYLLNLFCHSVSNMYFFAVWNLFQFDVHKSSLVNMCLLGWLFVFLAQILVIHLVCHFTSFEANRMAILLFEWRRRACRWNERQVPIEYSSSVAPSSAASYPELSSTLHYLHRRLDFTAAGCFSVNLNLLTSLFGHMTIYLVILLQIPYPKNYS